MSFLKRLFGGDKDKKPGPVRPSRPPATASRKAAPEHGQAADGTSGGRSDVEDAGPGAKASATLGVSTKELARQTGAGDKETRRAAAEALAVAKDRSAMRPLVTAYMNFGDDFLLKAAAVYGPEMTPSLLRDSSDVSIIGVRRSRLIRLLATTLDPEAAAAVRPYCEDPDPEIQVTACDALVQLGDTHGIDRLAANLKLTDAQLRTLSLAALRRMDHKSARTAVEEHVERYLAEAGAIPKSIEVFAPRLTKTDSSLTELVIEHIKGASHGLTVVTGSEAITMATNQRDTLTAALDGYSLRTLTRRAAPEEQISELLAARDEAAGNPAGRHVVLGALPTPEDSIPLPHFLTGTELGTFTAKIVLVDPHESRIVIEWFHFIQDYASVPTDLEVILAISTPERSALSAEEALIRELTPTERQADFPRAFLAHI